MTDPQDKPRASPARDEKGRLLPGSTANPGGKPRLPDFLRGAAHELVRLQLTAALEGTMPQHSTEPGNNAVEIVKVPQNIRADIAQHLVDRVYGKAPIAVEVSEDAAAVLSAILRDKG